VRIAPPLNIPRDTLAHAVGEIRSVFAELDAEAANPSRNQRAAADVVSAR